MKALRLLSRFLRPGIIPLALAQQARAAAVKEGRPRGRGPGQTALLVK